MHCSIVYVTVLYYWNQFTTIIVEFELLFIHNEHSTIQYWIALVARHDIALLSVDSSLLRDRDPVALIWHTTSWFISIIIIHFN